MSTNQSTTTMPTPGIAGRYFIAYRRERFSKLHGKVYVEFDRSGYTVYATIKIENADILSPRRLYRKFVEWCDDNAVYPYTKQATFSKMFMDLCDSAYAYLQRWSQSGFPEAHPHVITVNNLTDDLEYEYVDLLLWED